ncbi:hypothetical protein ACU610_25245 [Geodermatophilus sp. URMC 61]|uniref:hypothetical protein n=1 Tax=Geodermatophilus sp. URMC 61 TaxID=3423411 RepID=UPI00406CD86B
MATSRGIETTSVPGRVLLDGRPDRRPEAAADPDTNPLMVKSVSNASTFSRAGMRAIERTSRLQDLVDRNTPGEDTDPLVTFTRTGETETR